jgi:hypothetical protein
VACAFGVFFAAFAFFIGFISQTYGYMADRDTQTRGIKTGPTQTGGKETSRTPHYVMVYAAILFVFISAGLFLAGTIRNGFALLKLFE